MPPARGIHGPAATPDHSRFPSVRANQDVLRCSGQRVEAFDLLSIDLIAQALAVFLPIHSVGMLGDART